MTSPEAEPALSQTPPPDTMPYVPGRVLIRTAAATSVPAIAAAHGATPDRRIGPRLWRLTVPEGAEAAIAAALGRNSEVVFAELDRRPRLLAPPCDPCFVPNDAQFERKWDHHNDGDVIFIFPFETGKVDADIDWLEGFNYVGPNFTGSARIGIIDSGILTGHPDLCGKVVAGENFFAGTPGQTDDHGHGTHVAGIAAACANNGIGVTGVGYPANISLLAAKVCDAAGSCTSSAIVEAIYWAIGNGANVLNLSLGDTVPLLAVRAALQDAVAANVLPVCAAGNEGTRRVIYPAVDPECLAVSATNWGDALASYSSYGPEVDVSAPGGDLDDIFFGTSFIFSTANDGSYVANAGTSMASPQVAGLAALLFATGMNDAAQVRARIQSTADDLGPQGWDERFGHGRINMFRAVDGLLGDGWQNATPSAAFMYAPSSPAAGEAVNFDGTGSSDPDGMIAAWAWDFGDGGSGNGATSQHAYASAGSFTVTLTVTDDVGATAQVSHTVTVSAIPSDPAPAPTFRLNASALTGLADGDPVQTWTDPATGRTATAPGSAARATFRSAQTPAGTPALNFQGDDYYEVADESALELDGSSTVIAVYASDPISDQQTIVSKHTDASTPGAYFAAVDGSARLKVDRPWQQAGPLSATGLSVGTFQVIVMRVSGTQVDFRIDGVAVGGGTLPAGTATDRPLRVGVVLHRSPAILEYFLRGRLADLLIFNTGLADGHVAEWEATLAAEHLQAGNQAPVASFTFAPTSPAVSEAVSFDGTGSSDADGTITAWAWDFGDGTTASGATAQRAYSVAGSYTVTLSLTDDQGAADQISQTVTISAPQVNQAPTAGFSYSCDGAVCNFTDTSTDPDGSVVARSWLFGDGGTSTAPNPSHTYTAAGTHQVRLTVTDNLGLQATATRSMSCTLRGQRLRCR
ncbi:MAG: PKD domain-containing protein [Gemmatimonadetes bacterium]|nr:PKD domain-containing protein [Gemmatimonadota bacterium]